MVCFFFTFKKSRTKQNKPLFVKFKFYDTTLISKEYYLYYSLSKLLIQLCQLKNHVK